MRMPRSAKVYSRRMAYDTEINQVVTAWQGYLETAPDWRTIVENIEPKATGCGPVYDVPNPIERPNESFAISDMTGVKVAEPHYHANGETEIYIVLNGLGKTYVRDEVHELKPGVVVVTPPETTHFTIPEADLVMAVINTPPFSPHNVVDLHESNPAVGFDATQYKTLTANL